MISANLLHIYRTYEELKCITRIKRDRERWSIYRTYEELKYRKTCIAEPIRVGHLPYLWGIEIQIGNTYVTAHQAGIYRTYEELKCRWDSMNVGQIIGIYRTYEELKSSSMLFSVGPSP